MDGITCGSDQRKYFLNSANVMSENWLSPTAGRHETTLNTSHSVKHIKKMNK